jgi:hypothetical protein
MQSMHKFNNSDLHGNIMHCAGSTIVCFAKRGCTTVDMLGRNNAAHAARSIPYFPAWLCVNSFSLQHV